MDIAAKEVFAAGRCRELVVGVGIAGNDVTLEDGVLGIGVLVDGDVVLNARAAAILEMNDRLGSCFESQSVGVKRDVLCTDRELLVGSPAVPMAGRPPSADAFSFDPVVSRRPNSKLTASNGMTM